MQPSKLVAVTALLLAAAATAATATAQGGTPPDICSNQNAVWTPTSATCDFVCPDSSKWTMDCTYANEGVQCKVNEVGGGPGAVTLTCGMPPPGGQTIDATCSGTYNALSRTNNDCVMETIRTVLFTWQEGPAAAPAAEGP